MQLGDEAKDTITGFEGRITERWECIGEMTRFKLIKMDDNTGKIVEEWFSETRLVAK